MRPGCGVEPTASRRAWVWQGDITTFGREGAIVYDGKEFDALEPLFHLTGEHVELGWL